MLLYLEKIFFYLLIFCLPFQTRKIIYQWGDGFNEWISAYLYLTDLLLLLIFLLWFWRLRKERFFKKTLQFNIIIKSPSFWLVAFLIISLISLVQAANIQLAFYHWLKLLELAGLFFYLKYNFKSLFNLNRLAQVFVASAFVQSIIAFGQYTSQKSLGLRFLTESPLSPEIAGVAKIVVNNLKMIRPYGSFPHPNLLAAFLLISIFFLYFIWLSKKHSLINSFLLVTGYWVLVTALWLTFSRIIITIFVLTTSIYFIYIFWQARRTKAKELSKRIIGIFSLVSSYWLLITGLAWPEISSRFQISLTEQSVSLRAFYNETAFSAIREHPWLGMGLGNFVWQIRQKLDLLSSWLHQPVHNLYLLIASEIGLIGLVVFLFFLFQLFRRKIKTKSFSITYSPLFMIACSLLFLALFDHFFWTLQQGQLMFWLILGLIASQSLKKEKTPSRS